MDLIQLIIVIMVVGVLLWLVNTGSARPVTVVTEAGTVTGNAAPAGVRTFTRGTLTLVEVVY
jgi:hypothetical protein